MKNFNLENYNQWESYYEKAWQHRFDWMKRLITEEGETHPLRILSRFESFQRFHKFTSSSEEIMPFKKIPIQKDGNFFCENGQIKIMHHSHYPTGLPLTQIVPLLDKNFHLPTYYFKGITQFLLDYLTDEKFDAIVELGSGFSQNLVRLFYNGGPKIPYYGGEFTQSGTQCAAMWTELDPTFPLSPFRFDYKNPELTPVKEQGRILFFTCHSIEQVKVIPVHLPQVIAAHAREVVCIHFEPFGFQFQINQFTSEVDKQHRDFFVRKGWNQNLFDVLIKNHQDGHIRIDYIGKNIMGGNADNPTSIAVWKKP